MNIIKIIKEIFGANEVEQNEDGTYNLTKIIGAEDIDVMIRQLKAIENPSVDIKSLCEGLESIKDDPKLLEAFIKQRSEIEKGKDLHYAGKPEMLKNQLCKMYPQHAEYIDSL